MLGRLDLFSPIYLRLVFWPRWLARWFWLISFGRRSSCSRWCMGLFGAEYQLIICRREDVLKKLMSLLEIVSCITLLLAIRFWHTVHHGSVIRLSKICGWSYKNLSFLKYSIWIVSVQFLLDNADVLDSPASKSTRIYCTLWTKKLTLEVIA